MSSLEPLGKLLIIAGAFIIVIGLLVIFWIKIPILGKLPGDIFYQKGNFRFFFPIVTSLVVSITLTTVISLITRVLGQ